ncbi:hypothetical protein HY450_03795 [Candidatus Pacearchaeota archaeon]|nr:hypothetical protein [Candidatus Pacearchaeota archaeon]
MVYKIKNEKLKIFVESLLITLVLITIGFTLGFYVEFQRTNKVVENYNNFEIEALDLKLQNYYYQIMDRASCEQAIEQNFIFADDLYLRGLDLEKYEEASQLTENIKSEKKKYVLLKTELWLNSILLKERCGADFDTIVYIYENEPNSNGKVSEQQVISNVLKTIKEKKGNSVILLPIAGDLELNSVDLQKRIYNVTYLPTLIINEKTTLEGFHSEEEIENYLTN